MGFIILAFISTAIAIPAWYKLLMMFHQWAEAPVDRKIREASWLVRKTRKEIQRWKIRRLERLKQEHEASINELNEALIKSKTP